MNQPVTRRKKKNKTQRGVFVSHPPSPAGVLDPRGAKRPGPSSAQPTL